MSNFNEIRRMNLEIQERKLELQETNARARAKELMVKEK
jgi:AmiR/NasT family two-component response regulator